MRWPFVVFALSLLACRTREDGAQKVGRAAAQEASLSCEKNGGDMEACRERICRERCAPFADSTRLSETCNDKCKGQGSCDSDRDCLAGSVCTMIAPVLRRCLPPFDADAGAAVP